MSISMWSSMKAWILKHNALIPAYIVAVFVIISIMIMLYLIYRTLWTNPVCDTNSLMTILGTMSEGIIEYSVKDLKEATNNFAENNHIGSGSFGPVYVGLLQDTFVAVKMLAGSLHPRFLDEVIYLFSIQHCNVVNLVGYCCENEQQMLVYEYYNGNMRNYLRGTVHSIDLKFKKRISIAIGAAKGLLYLHSLTPPLTHKRFKAANVFLDANFNAKVSDVGLSRLLETRNEEANDDHDLEVGFVNQESFNESNDVYSFGLFLLELISGEETEGLTSRDELREWLGPRVLADTLVDERMNGTFTSEAMYSVEEIIRKCLSFPAINRPKMEEVVTELEKINLNGSTREECFTRLTLGSELFTINE